MKRSFGRLEIAFDGAYLLGALAMGIALAARPSPLSRLAGAMALVLALGDMFHLLPRMRAIATGREKALAAAIGRGKQITSITMTVFYLMLWQLGVLRYSLGVMVLGNAVMLSLAALRVVFCLLPQNRWQERYPPVDWGVLRNIPFVFLGLLTAALYFLYRGEAPGFAWMWLAILLSFACYLPVVFLANRKPRVGMLMLPKTCMYLWMLGMCFSL